MLRIISTHDQHHQPVLGRTIMPYLPTLLAVYGTLKRGCPNHRLMERFKFIGTGVSMDDQFHMTPTKGRFPILYTLPQEGYSRVSVELYTIPDEDALKRVDQLEGHPDWYVRKPFTFLTDEDKLVTAEMYVQEWNLKQELPEVMPEVVEWKAA